MKLSLKKIFKRSLLIPLIFFSASLNPIFSEELIYEKNLTRDFPTSDYLKKLPSNDYLLGEGDLISLSLVKDYDELRVELLIDSLGTIYLPRLGRVYVSGLSISELERILNKDYKPFVKEPNVEIVVVKYRPVRVYIDGAIMEPGLYTLTGSKSDTIIGPIDTLNLRSTNQNNLPDEYDNTRPVNKDYYFPTIYDVIKTAGGINYYSDLSDIKVVRKNSLSNGGGKISTNLNFLNVLNGSNPELNLRVYDGDYIKIKTSKTPLLNQISDAIKSNLNPEFISIGVSGRVENPGVLSLKRSSTLNEAIFLSGGPKFLKGKVNFLRVNQGGELDRRVFAFNKKAKRGSYKNPFLMSGDIIYVGKSNLNIANEVISEVFGPFTNLYGAYKFFDLDK